MLLVFKLILYLQAQWKQKMSSQNTEDEAVRLQCVMVILHRRLESQKNVNKCSKEIHCGDSSTGRLHMHLNAIHVQWL